MAEKHPAFNASVKTLSSKIDLSGDIPEQRHPHPHIDPRQPRHQSQPEVNPPVFAWKPLPGHKTFRLIVRQSGAGSEENILDISGITDPCYLPEKAFAPGEYEWKWLSGDRESPTFRFTITETAIPLEIPPIESWLEHFSGDHPRIYLRPENRDDFKRAMANERKADLEQLRQQADMILQQPHEIAEPPYLPDREVNYQDWFDKWFHIMWDSRRFVLGAELLGLAWLASGDAKYARAACQRMVSISRWDPDGASTLDHNDEAHMSVIWHGTQACDFIWDEFTEEERALVIQQFKRRGEITFEHMRHKGTYGVTRFDSHAGREIVFLALMGLVFHETIPAAITWLEWLRPVLCGIWPVWAGQDGGWSEGISYATAYVEIMTMFASALKTGAGIDLYQQPFWKGHAKWRQYCWMPYAEWIGFGDHSERWARSWNKNADLVDLIARETNETKFSEYIRQMRTEAATCPPDPPARRMPGILTQLFVKSPQEQSLENGTAPMLAVFPGAGWAAIRTNFTDAKKDLAFLFRCSPFGSVSHSHANNNDFILHVGGKVMAMPSGYYAGYGSAHHAHWVWHTKSHNCITLSDAPQLLRSHDAVGAIANSVENEAFIYFCGVADASYQDRAECCRRHVVFFKESSCLLLIDEFRAKPGMVSSLQWNLHSWADFKVNDTERTFTFQRDDVTVHAHMLFHKNAYFSTKDVFDPPPSAGAKSSDQWLPQYHLRFTPVDMPDQQNLAVILAPESDSFQLPLIKTSRQGNMETARIGDIDVFINSGEGIKIENIDSDAVAVLKIGKKYYEIDAQGIHTQ